MPGQSIQLNGKTHLVPGPLTVVELLDSLGFTGKPVVVELEGRALTPQTHAVTMIQPGAAVEIVVLAAGG